MDAAGGLWDLRSSCRPGRPADGAFRLARAIRRHVVRGIMTAYGTRPKASRSRWSSMVSNRTRASRASLSSRPTSGDARPGQRTVQHQTRQHQTRPRGSTSSPRAGPESAHSAHPRAVRCDVGRAASDTGRVRATRPRRPRPSWRPLTVRSPTSISKWASGQVMTSPFPPGD